jgi:RimJ/RimL family protein N-acetyltransferase
VDVYGTTVTNASLLQTLPDFDWVLLVDEAGIVAASSVAPHDSGQWLIVFSGTSPRARGRGLARAAKEQAHAYARRGGATHVQTTNEERNARIRALNESMGYRRANGELRLVRRG